MITTTAVLTILGFNIVVFVLCVIADKALNNRDDWF